MRADRLLSIMLLLKAQGKLTAQQLAERLEVSRRTVLRDIEALSTAGVPIYTEGGYGGGIFLDDNYRISLTDLNASEILALFISNVTGPLADIGLGVASTTARQKLLAELPRSYQAEVERNRQRLLIDTTGWWPDNRAALFFDLFQQAINQEQMITAAYERSDIELVERILEPYSLVAKANVWYVVARHNQQFKVYRLSRFKAVTLLDHFFIRETDFDLTAFWNEHRQNFMATLPQYPCTIKLEPASLSFLKWFVYDPYEVLNEPDADGWLIVKLQLASITAAKMLLFGLGTAARPLDPPELCAAMQETAQAILQVY